MTIHASDLLGKALKRQGVDTIFYLMGGPMFTAERACVAEGIRPALERASAAAKQSVPALINVRTDARAMATTGRFSTYYEAA